jgi:hypothetical protein
MPVGLGHHHLVTVNGRSPGCSQLSGTVLHNEPWVVFDAEREAERLSFLERIDSAGGRGPTPRPGGSAWEPGFGRTWRMMPDR